VTRHDPPKGGPNQGTSSPQPTLFATQRLHEAGLAGEGLDDPQFASEWPKHRSLGQVRRNDAPTSRIGDPETSQAPRSKSADLSLRARVELALIEAGGCGATDDELQVRTGHQHLGSVGRRRGELRDDLLVFDSGRTRLTRCGSAAIVWVHYTHRGATGSERVA